MTQKQATAAYPNQLRLSERLNTGDKLFLSIPSFEIADITFTVFFDFGKDDSLCRVSLEHSGNTLEVGQCYAEIGRLLENKYGTPKEDPVTRLKSSTWSNKRWSTPATSVSLSERVDPLESRAMS